MIRQRRENVAGLLALYSALRILNSERNIILPPAQILLMGCYKAARPYVTDFKTQV
jgi:hypothetical protein